MQNVVVKKEKKEGLAPEGPEVFRVRVPRGERAGAAAAAAAAAAARGGGERGALRLRLAPRPAPELRVLPGARRREAAALPRFAADRRELGAESLALRGILLRGACMAENVALVAENVALVAENVALEHHCSRRRRFGLSCAES